MDTTQPSPQPPPELAERLAAALGEQPEFLVCAPGRVDLIGAHTDYNDGWVLPAAIDRHVWLAARRQPEAVARVRALDMPEGEVAFRLAGLDAKRDLDGAPLPGWGLYAAGVAWSLQKAGLATPGLRMALSSQIPVGAGLSSSAAVEAAYALAWAHSGGWEVERMALAQLCQRAENEYVGVASGLMDQFACLFGCAGCALLFDCRTLEWEAVPLPDQVALVVADTGESRALAGSAYNQRRAECKQAVRALQAALPHVRALRDVSAEELAAHRALIPEPARQRAQHVVEENERVLAAARALRAGEVAALGDLMDRSYLSARDLFEAGGPALEAMWQASLGHPARLGGRFIGAGWAGCMIFLVEAGGAEDFASALRRRTSRAAGREPALYTLQAADGARVLPFDAG